MWICIVNRPMRQTIQFTIRDNKIVVFSKTWCGYSRAAKAYFADEFPGEKVEAVEYVSVWIGSTITHSDHSVIVV